MIYEFNLPDLGEGLTEGELVKWHVKEGDAVKENDPVCSVLTDKAEVEIPSPKTGKVVKLMAKAGEKVQVHAPLISFDVAGGGQAAPAAAASVAAAAKTAVSSAPSPAKASAGATVSATPAVRKLASDLKVDLAALRGSGPAGRITEDDVRRAAGASGNGVPHAAPGSSGVPAGVEEKVPFIGIRRRTAEKMSQSWATVPHVAHVDEADFTALVKLRQEMKPEAEKKSVKLTYLPFIMKALVKTFKEFPDLNATLDEKGGFIVRKRCYHIGIAASTPAGLLVPVVRDVDKKDIWVLAADISRLAEKARAGKIEPAELSGGTFTITNIGPIGGLFATPIILHPETAILAVMKLREQPAVRDGAVQIRTMGNLVLSFDHRVFDGAEAAHAMNTLIKCLENPRTLL